MDLFDLVAKITLDSSGYERGLQDAEGKTSSFAGKLKSGFATAGKIAAAGIAVVGGAAVAVGKQALESYANYEQLVGGVETLFKGSAAMVQEYAANAYKTAGLSANEYMETVTSFSASLLQSLGGDTEKAAKIGDMAITDMSDNANKMGSSMEAIQMAYQGFAKQNYTMLDNLKLGYGGTKTEMERLLKDATAISGVEYDISSLSDVYEAIHVIQGELEITGTTAKEASTTISGSVDSMKSAWQNLLTGIADDNADFEVLVSNFVDSVVTVGSNIIPRVNNILGGLGKLINEAANKLVPLVVDTIVENLPQIIESGVNLVVSLISGLIGAIPQLVRSIPQIIKAIINGFVSAWPQLKQAGIDLLKMVGNGINSMISAVVGWGRNVLESIKNGILNGISALASVGMNIVRGIWNGISNGIGWIKSKISGWVGSVVSFIKGQFGIHSPSRVMRDEVGKFIAQGIAKGIEDDTKKVDDAAEKLASSVYNDLKKWADKTVKYNKMSLSEQISLWEDIQSQYQEGSEQFADANDKLFDLREKRLDEYVDTVKGIYETIDDLEEEYQKKYDDRVNAIANSYNLFDAVQKRREVDGQKLIKNLKDQIATINEFYAGVEELSKRGGRAATPLVIDIQEMGVGAIDRLNALLALSDDKLNEYVDLYWKKYERANELAEEQLKGFRKYTDQQIQSNMLMAQNAGQEYALTQTFNGGINISIDGTGKNAEEIGRDLYKLLLRQGVTAYAV